MAVWVHSDFQFREWKELRCEDLETLWLTVWSKQMPYDYSRMIIGVIYHPDKLVADHYKMIDHIALCVEHIRKHHPYAGVIITGDFNKLPDYHLKSQLQLKQIFTKPTRGKVTLDKLFTNMTQFYTDTIVSAPIGKSDHDIIIAYPKHSLSYRKGKVKSVTMRVNGHNERVMFAHHLQQIRWDELYYTELCIDKAVMFNNVLQELYDTCFPLKVVLRHEKDKPWITDHYKSLICRRQPAKEAGDMDTYNWLRNQVNRLTPTLKQ